MTDLGVITYRLICKTDAGDVIADVPVSVAMLEHEEQRSDSESMIRTHAHWSMRKELTKFGNPKVIAREWWRGGFQDDDFIRDRMPVRLTGKEWR